MDQKSGMQIMRYCAILLLVMVCVACSSESGQQTTSTDGSEILVEVGKSSLTRAQVEAIIPQGLEQHDSILAAESYIKLWIKDQLLFEKAEENLGKDETIRELVDNYRHSLVVFTYQERLLKERLSKSVSDKELLDYYNEHNDQFKLSNNIIRGIFLVVPQSSPQLENFKKWYKNVDDIEQIEKNYLRNTSVYELFNDKWVGFEEILDRIPVKISDANSFLRTNKYIEVQDSTNVYLLNIKDYKLQDEVAPFDYARSKVLEIMLNQRKSTFLSGVENDLYKDALQNKKIKFYYKTEDLAR